MDYLRKYNLNDQDISEIINNIDEKDALEYDIHEENVVKILDYFVNRGIDIKELLIKKSYLFYVDAEVLIDRLNQVDDLNINIIDELI